MDFTEIISWFNANWQEWFIYDPRKPILFNSGLFLVLFLLFYPIYILTTNAKTYAMRNLYVVAFSLFFYYKSSGLFFALLIFTSVFDYNIGQLLYAETRRSRRKLLLAISIFINLGLLVYFKYTNFLIDNYNSIFSGDITFYNIILPVGISFYTFQSMSYVIDIYRKELEPARNVIDYMFFVSFFPQLVAGPIVRAADFIPQIYKRLNLTKEDVNTALFLIIGGLIKKAVISDYISVNFVDRVFDAPMSYSAFENLMASYGYALQIYCDFSGYSDMAIGIALLMGFVLPPNFRTPYKSGSITEFWRRWHISLSTWLRDYLYISLGGNRKGKFRTYLNLFITMLLGGLWHGASWKFVIWGILHGLALVVERLFKNVISIPKNYVTRFLRILLTFHFVVFCWIFFRAKDFATAFTVIANISEIQFKPEQWLTVLSGYQNVFILMLVGYVWHFLPTAFISFLKSSFDKMPILVKSFILALTFWVVYATATSGSQPFIYFQF